MAAEWPAVNHWQGLQPQLFMMPNASALPRRH